MCWFCDLVILFLSIFKVLVASKKHISVELRCGRDLVERNAKEVQEVGGSSSQTRQLSDWSDPCEKRWEKEEQIGYF